MKKSNFTNEGLHEQTIDFTNVHLGLAIEYLYESRVWKQWNKSAFSSIIHGFIALESYVNYLGHELFFNEDAHMYLSIDKNQIANRRLLAKWNSNLPILDKIDFILSQKNVTIPGKLRLEIMELNNLRNWLMHGFTFKSLVLLEPVDGSKNHSRVLDIEDSVDWEKKFPITNFNLRFLDTKDAEVASEIILKALKILVGSYLQPILIQLSDPKLKIMYISHEEENNIYDILRGNPIQD